MTILLSHSSRRTTNNKLCSKNKSRPAQPASLSIISVSALGSGSWLCNFPVSEWKCSIWCHELTIAQGVRIRWDNSCPDRRSALHSVSTSRTEVHGVSLSTDLFIFGARKHFIPQHFNSSKWKSLQMSVFYQYFNLYLTGYLVVTKRHPWAVSKLHEGSWR